MQYTGVTLSVTVTEKQLLFSSIQDGCYNFRTKPNQKLLKAKPVSGSAAPVRAHWPSFLLVTVGGSAEGAEQQPFQSNMAAAFATRSRIFQMYLSSSLAKFLPRSALINGPLLGMRTRAGSSKIWMGTELADIGILSQLILARLYLLYKFNTSESTTIKWGFWYILLWDKSITVPLWTRKQTFGDRSGSKVISRNLQTFYLYETCVQTV